MAPPAAPAKLDRVLIRDTDHLSHFAADLNAARESKEFADVVLHCAPAPIVKEDKEKKDKKNQEKDKESTEKDKETSDKDKDKNKEASDKESDKNEDQAAAAEAETNADSSADKPYPTLRVHRAVLASISDFLAGLLAPFPLEEDVHLTLDATPLQVAEKIVEFAYGGEVKIAKPLVSTVCDAAHRLQIKFLKDSFVKITDKDYAAVKAGKKTLASLKAETVASAAAAAAAGKGSPKKGGKGKNAANSEKGGSDADAKAKGGKGKGKLQAKSTDLSYI